MTSSILPRPGLGGIIVSVREQVLLDLAQWLSRAQQYSVLHPSCAALAGKMEDTIARALGQTGTLEYGILRDDVMIGSESAVHPAVRTRIAPHLHERGVLLLRFTSGVTAAELTAFVELLTWSAQKTFDGGGLARLLIERRTMHVHVSEFAHDISDEERDEHRKRKQLRTFFRETLQSLLALREGGQPIGDQLAELLENPEVAVAILEDESQRRMAQGVAGLALMVQQEELRSGRQLADKLRRVMLTLSSDARDQVILGFPPLVGEFRAALAWAVDGFSVDDLGRFAFPSFRAHAAELEIVLYAFSVLALRRGRRMSAVRRVALMLHDLQDEEAVPIFEILAPAPETFDSFFEERTCLSEGSRHALASRVSLDKTAEGSSVPPITSAPSVFGGRNSTTDLVRLSAMAPGFDRFCARMPIAADLLANDGSIEAVIGIIRGLGDAPKNADLAAHALREVAASPAAPHVLREIDRVSSAADGEELNALVAIVQLITSSSPGVVCDQLERSESRKMRRILLDALSHGGPGLLPIAMTKLRSSSWFVVRNFVSVVARAGGTPRDVELASRNPNEKVRLEVVRALRGMPPDSTTMDIAARYLTDPSEEIRRGSLPLLKGELLGSGAIGELARIGGEEQQSEETRRVAIMALGRSADDAAAAGLFKMIQPRGLLEAGATTNLRDVAAMALASSPAPSARTHFAEGLESSVRRVRKAFERAAKERNE